MGLLYLINVINLSYLIIGVILSFLVLQGWPPDFTLRGGGFTVLMFEKCGAWLAGQFVATVKNSSLCFKLVFLLLSDN